MKKILLILAFTINLFGIDLEDFITKIGTKCIEPSRVSFLGEFSSGGIYKDDSRWKFYHYADGRYSCYDDKIKSLDISRSYKGVLPYGLDFGFNKEEIIKTIGRPYTKGNYDIKFLIPNIKVEYYFDWENHRFNTLSIYEQAPVIYSIDVKINKKNPDYLVLEIKAEDYKELNKVEYIIEAIDEKKLYNGEVKINGKVFNNKINIDISNMADGMYKIKVKVKVINKDLYASETEESYSFDKKSSNFLSGNPYFGRLCFDKEDSLETWTLGLLKHKKCRVKILEVYNERYKVEAINRVSACPKDKEFMIDSKLLCEYQEKKGLK